jgi:hypothetical protein
MSNTSNLSSLPIFTLSLNRLGCNSDDYSHDGSEQETTIEAASHCMAHVHGVNSIAGHGGKVIPLGETTIGSFNVMAYRDMGNMPMFQIRFQQGVNYGLK